MTTKHANVELLIGFANGRKLQFKDPLLPASERDQWHALEVDNTAVWPWLLSTDPNDDRKRFEFRLAPRTIMIGDVECEAPALDLEDDKKYWSYDICSAQAYETTYKSQGSMSTIVGACGLLFSSPEAAIAAHKAVTKLLTGNSPAS